MGIFVDSLTLSALVARVEQYIIRINTQYNIIRIIHNTAGWPAPV